MVSNYFFEKVNPMHPDKIADRIAGAMVDLAYKKNDKKPICAFEVLIGHGECNIIGETNVLFSEEELKSIVHRIAKDNTISVHTNLVCQDSLLAENQSQDVAKCGDNGIFKGTKTNRIEQAFTNLMSLIYEKFPYDGKGIIHFSNDFERKINKADITICQSNAKEEEIKEIVDFWLDKYKLYLYLKRENLNLKINPLGFWQGGINVDTGATNRKLGSDMARAVTGGGLCGKDTSKADVSLNILAYLLANETKDEDIDLMCSIGDTDIYSTKENKIIMTFQKARKMTDNFIKNLGGFEKFAEWGIIRPRNLF